MSLGTEVGLSPGHIVLDGDPAPTERDTAAPHFSAHVYCGQTAACIKMALDMEVGLSPGHIVLDGDPALPSKKGHSPQISAHGPCLLWPNGWMDQDGTWRGGRPWPKPQCARWGPSSPPQKRGTAPQFSAHVYCGQTAGWIKMPFGIMEVGLGPGHVVLDGDPAPLQFWSV